MPKLSVLINTYNEEKMIAGCLEHLLWADEVVVADSESTDNTVKIAQQYPVKVVPILRTNFSEMRNAGLKQLSGDWVLLIDADERVTPELANEIQRVLADSPKEVGFYMTMHHYFLGKWIKHCGWHPRYKLRLYKRTENSFYKGLVHESLNIQGEIGYLKNHIDHFSYTSIEQFVNKTNLYTTLAAQEALNKGRRVNLFKIVFRPIRHFLKTYLFRLGFLDGVHGLILCVLQSYYVFLRTVKTWMKAQANTDGRLTGRSISV